MFLALSVENLKNLGKSLKRFVRNLGIEGFQEKKMFTEDFRIISSGGNNDETKIPGTVVNRRG
jgi:hypothetical protein